MVGMTHMAHGSNMAASFCVLPLHLHFMQYALYINVKQTK
jgi:hypothetical protein